MKYLIFTRSAWDDTNSTGNTMSNFFSGISKECLANLYVRAATPENDVCINYYSISDKEILMSVIPPFKSPGRQFNIQNVESDQTKKNREKKQEKGIYSFFRNNPSVIMLWLQYLLWGLGTWKNEKLEQFLDDFKPDVIFSTSFHTSYTHWLLWYIRNKSQSKVVLFHADNYLISKTSSKNPLKILNEKMKRKRTLKSINKADINFCISELQKKEYEKLTGKKMEILYKGSDFSSRKKYILPEDNKVIKVVYAGSLLYGRWKTLSVVAEAIKKINENEIKAELDIYSQYELTSEMKKNILLSDNITFFGKISPSDIKKVYSEADLLLHVESFDLIEREATKMSFSTKIVDLLNSGRSILAAGWKEAASIDYLRKNDAAFVADDYHSVFSVLKEVTDNRKLLSKYSKKSWDLGAKNHELEKIQKRLYEKINSLESKQNESNTN